MQPIVKSCSTYALVLVAGIWVTAARAADGWTEKTTNDFYALTIKYGVSTLRAAAASSDTVLPPSSNEVSLSQRQAMEKALGGYVSYRASAQGSLDTLRSATGYVVDSTALVMTASGVGAVPAAIFKATAQVSTDMVFGSMQADINENLSLYLKRKEGALMQIAGGDYETLRNDTPANIKAKLDSQGEVFDEIENMLGSDPIAKERTKDMIVQALRNTDKAILDKISATDERLTGVAARVGKLTEKFVKFQQVTVSVLDRHEKALVSLSTDLTKLQGVVGGIDERLRVQENNAGFVVDFVYDRMEPGEKAIALQGGFMAERFKCPASDTNCDGAKLKAQLIDRFQTEARIKRTVETIGRTASALNDVASIAANIGIALPPAFGKAVQFGNAAASAFAAFSTGNYLGALSAATSVLMKRKDPDEERFKMLMGYLDQQFTQINAKLDAILQNQQKMMDALIKLSDQMRSYYVALDSRLARMEFELNRVGDAARAELWKDWQSCYTLYDHLGQNEDRYEYLANGDFRRLDDIYAAIGTIGDSAGSCVRVGQDAPTSIAAADKFGNFLSANLAYEFTPDILPPEEQSGEVHTKTDLQIYIEKIHAPARDLFIDLLSRSDLSRPRGVELLINPNFSYDNLAKRVGMKASGTACGTSGYLHDRVRRLLCGTPGTDQAALRLLATPMVVDTALVVTDWLLAASRFADLTEQGNNKFVDRDELFAHALKTQGSMSPGQDIVRKTQTMLDAAVAGYSLIHGDLTARAVADVLFGPEPAAEPLKAKKAALKAQAIPLLRANPYLRANVAMILLHDRYRQRNPGSTQPSAVAYRTAYLYALNTVNDRTFLLKGMFGDDLIFDVDPKTQKITVNLTGLPGTDRLPAPVPEVAQFLDGRFIYPARFNELLTARQRVVDRLADYQAVATLSKVERVALVQAVARAEQRNPEKAKGAGQ